MIEILTDLEAVVRLIAIVAATHVTLTSLEHLSTRERFDPEGILSWKVSEQYLRNDKLLSPVLGPVLKYPRFRWTLVVRLLAGLLLGGSALLGHVSPVLLVVLLVTNVGIAYRHQGGLSGDFQMSTVIIAGLLVSTLFPGDETARLAGVLFIAAQSTLSYVVAGVSKLLSDEWRNGSAISGIFATETWGDQRVYQTFERRPSLRLLSAWVVIAFECLFPLAVFLDSGWPLVIVATGVLFHLFNAVFMGLNGFLLAFPATYPAVLHLNYLVQQSGITKYVLG